VRSIANPQSIRPECFNAFTIFVTDSLLFLSLLLFEDYPGICVDSKRTESGNFALINRLILIMKKCYQSTSIEKWN